MPRFSILIPAFKKKYLKKCLESIFAQTFPFFEIIIVNDASPEDIDAVVSAFHDNRLRYYKNEINYGAFNVVDNWNKCLNYCSGDFVMCIGDDDELAPNCLKVYSELIEEFPDVDLFHCRSNIINENSEVIGLTPSRPKFESVYSNMWHRIMGYRTQFIGDYLFRRVKLESVGGFYKLPLAWASDDISAYLAMDRGVVHTETPLFNYRQSNVTISSSGSVMAKIEAIKSEKQWYSNFIKKDCKIKNEVESVFFSCIKKELPHYIKIKIINTIAFNGIKKNSLLVDFCFWVRKRKTVGLNIQELFYILFLAIKKIKGGRYEA